MDIECRQFMPLEVQRIVVDEIGMVRLDLFEYIVKMIWNTYEEFGKKPARLIVVGDFAQTRAFVAREEKQEYYEAYGRKIQCYESAMWEDCDFRMVRLCKVRRQEEGDVSVLEVVLVVKVNDSNGRISQSAKTDGIPQFVCADVVKSDKGTILLVERE